VLGIRYEDVADVGDPRRDDRGGMYIRLARTKTGPNQHVQVFDSHIVGIVRALRDAAGPGARLFPVSANVFRKRFEHECAVNGLPHFVPHSLRHGGATYLSACGWPNADVRRRGRWKNSDSANHYIQEGPAAILALKVPRWYAEWAHLCADDLPAALEVALRLRSRFSSHE